MKKAVRAAMLQDLARSGLDSRHARSMRVRALGIGECIELTEIKESVGYVIPYLDPEGRNTSFYRVKIMSAADPEAPRYWQEKGSRPRLYLPPLLNGKGPRWPEVVKNPSRRLLITEGEKKAAAACARGIVCAALGGVWTWTSRKKGVRLLPDMEDIVWRGREVALVFDSDVEKKSEVRLALDQLASELAKRGAGVTVVHLPGDEDEKVGLDDFLLERTPEDFWALPSTPHVVSAELLEMNRELCVLDGGRVLNLRTMELYGSVHNLRVDYADRTVVGPRGGNTPMVDQWLAWPMRRRHRDLVYAPGQPAVTENNEVNLWRGWGTQPEEGDVSPLLELVETAVPDRRTREWFLRWLAYPVQRPGAKMFSAVLLWSTMHGTGKSFIGQVMLDVYGQNGVEITQADLHGGFNDWLAEKQFVLGEEVSSTERRRDADLLKNIITGESVRVNKKYVPAYSVRSCANFLFCSNHPDAVALERDDRRFTVIEMALKMPLKFFQRLDRWRKAGGSRHWHRWLLDHDCGSFDPKAPAAQTDAKRRMVQINLSGVDRWCDDLMCDPRGTLGPAATDRDLFTVSEIQRMMPEELRNTSTAALGKSLARAGAFAFGTPIRLSASRGVLRLIAIRNVDEWRAERDGARWREHYAARVQR